MLTWPGECWAAHDEPFLLPPFAVDAPLIDWFDHTYPGIPSPGAINFLGQDVTGAKLWQLPDGRWSIQEDDHPGHDWFLPEGTPVLAAADGQVVGVNQSFCTVPEFGVSIQHNRTGHGVTRYQTIYGHLGSANVQTGDSVVAGQVIGFIAPGNRPECHVHSSHLHFHIWRFHATGPNSPMVRVDPYGWIGSPEIPDDPWATHPDGGPSYYLWLVPPRFPDLPPQFGPSVGLWINAKTFQPGSPTRIDVVANPRTPERVDVYAGAVLPASAGPTFGCTQGDAVAFLGNGEVSFRCLSSPLPAFVPFRRDIPMTDAFPQTVTPQFLEFMWPADAPRGDYTFFLALTEPGASNIRTVATVNARFASPPPPGTIAVDGNPADWAGIPVLSSDPAGDGPFNANGDYFPGEDFVNVSAANDASNVYFLFEFAGTFSGGITLFLDTDENPGTGCGGYEFVMFVTATEPGANLALGDYRNCQIQNSFPGAVTSAKSGTFVELSVPISVFRTLTPGMTGFRIKGVAGAPPPSGVNDEIGPGTYSFK
jgi:hypothetical protein